MNAVKNLISNCNIIELNLASNMISQNGLQIISDDLIRNTMLKSIDVFMILYKYIYKLIKSNSLELFMAAPEKTACK